MTDARSVQPEINHANKEWWHPPPQPIHVHVVQWGRHKMETEFFQINLLDDQEEHD